VLLTSRVTALTVSNSGDGVQLPTARAGLTYEITVDPDVGNVDWVIAPTGTNNINNAGAGTSVAITTAVVRLVCSGISTSRWVCVKYNVAGAVI